MWITDILKFFPFPSEVEKKPASSYVSFHVQNTMTATSPIPTPNIIPFHLPHGYETYLSDYINDYHYLKTLQCFLSMEQTSIWPGPFLCLQCHLNLIVYTPSTLDYPALPEIPMQFHTSTSAWNKNP